MNVRLMWPACLTALGLATALTVALAQDPASGAFSGAAGSSGNSVTTGTWCAAPGGATIIAAGDSYVTQSAAASNNGTQNRLDVRSAGPSDNRRALVRFPSLPAIPSYCTLTSATLRLYDGSATAGNQRTVRVYRADPATPWTESTVTWANAPDGSGSYAESATPTGAGWQQWTVTTQVGDLYAGVDNGFLIRDAVEGASPGVEHIYRSRETTEKPQLVLAWE